jgi:UDP-glucose 4-epimerase
VRTLLLTGARGLIGDAVLRYFRAAGWRIVAACSGAVRGAVDGITAVPFNLGMVSGEPLESALSACDAVVHGAALRPSAGTTAPAATARDLYVKNGQGTFGLMEMAARHRVRSFIFISGVNLFGQPPELISEDVPPSPVDVYMLSKLAGEMAADFFNRTSKTQFYTLRTSAPYGARFTTKAVIPTFVTRAMAGQPLQLMGSGRREQVFTYVDDIARACLLAINADAPGVYNIAGGAPTTMMELAEAVVRAVGETGAAIEFTKAPDPNDGARRRVSIARAKRNLGWEPEYDIDRGLARMVEEIRVPPEPLLLPAEV